MIGGVYSSSFVLFSQSHVLRSYGVASYARTRNEKKKPPPPLTTTTTMPSLFSFCSSRYFPSQFVSFLLFSSSALMMMMMMILNEDEKEDEDDARDRTDDHHEASSSVFSSSSSFSFSIRVVFVRIRISWWWYHRKTEPQKALQRDIIIQFFCVKKCFKKCRGIKFDIFIIFITLRGKKMSKEKKNIPKQNNRHTHTHTHKDIVVVVTEIQEQQQHADVFAPVRRGYRRFY